MYSDWTLLWSLKSSHKIENFSKPEHNPDDKQGRANDENGEVT